MTKSESPQQSDTLTTDQSLQQAVSHHQAGRLQEAELLYLAILQARPDHPETNHNMGVLAVQRQQAAASLPHFIAALDADPARGQYWLSYIDALFQAGQLDDARQILEQARQQGLEGPGVEALASLLAGGEQVAGQANAGVKDIPSASPAVSLQEENPCLQEINTLVSLFNQGRFTEATPLAQQMTVRFPVDGFGWKALGFAFQQRGRLAEAIEPLQKAAALLPNDAETHNNLGIALQSLGRLDEAEARYRQALHINPNYAQAHGNLGANLQALGRLGEAETCYRRALQIQPDYAKAHCNLGALLHESGRLDEAEASFRRALQIKPDYAEAQYNLGNTLQKLNRQNEAEDSYRQALQIKPDYAEAHSNLGNILKELGRLDEAEASYRRALQIKPDYVEAHNNLGAILRQLGRLPEAEVCFRQVLQIKPDFAGAYYNIGNMHLDKGQFAEAEAFYRQALAIEPEMPEAWGELASIRKMTPADSDWLSTAESIVQRDLPARQEFRLRYAMGKYCDDVRDFDRAFENYRRANELKKSLHKGYDRQQFTDNVDRLIRDYPMERLRQTHGGASASERPLFIVGMPRSGTSLTEQIIASHPATFGAGELLFWNDADRRFTAASPEAREDALLRTLANDCLQNLADFSATALRVANKLPGNVMHLGLIHTVFPNARILHTQRNPIDTCLSIHFQDFTAMHRYSNDLGDLAHRYREYRRLMAHWRTVLPAQVFLDVPYEALLEDQEGWSRKIIEFIGLDWDARCLDFHKTERKVGTASNWQVRQKIYTSSKERWRNYEKYIGPLRDLLEVPPQQTS
jgi:tetratricopeptide (TPR) repeat protein